MKWGSDFAGACKKGALAEPLAKCESFIGKPMACL